MNEDINYVLNVLNECVELQNKRIEELTIERDKWCYNYCMLQTILTKYLKENKQ